MQLNHLQRRIINVEEDLVGASEELSLYDLEILYKGLVTMHHSFDEDPSNLYWSRAAKLFYINKLQDMGII